MSEKLSKHVHLTAPAVTRIKTRQLIHRKAVRRVLKCGLLLRPGYRVNASMSKSTTPSAAIKMRILFTKTYNPRSRCIKLIQECP